MNCEQARLQVGADPGGTTPELEAHVAGCADCAGYRREMRALEGDLRLALAWPREATAGSWAAPADVVAGAPGASAGLDGRVGAGLDNVVSLSRPPAPPTAEALPRTARADAYSAPLPMARRWALAASVLVAGVLATLFFALQPRDALAAAVVAHLGEEPDAWSRTQPIPRSALQLVLARSGVRLDRVESGDVVYAHSCFFRGRNVPHLVVSTPTGPVTVLVLRGEAVTKRVEFEEGRYSGVLLPVPGGGGGIAVLARGGTGTGTGSGSGTGTGSGKAAGAGGKPDVEAAATAVLAALQFEDEAPPAAR